MNRENKRIRYQKDITKNHVLVVTVLLVKYVVALLFQQVLEVIIAITVQIAFCSIHVDEQPGDREADCGGIMEPLAYGYAKTENGQLFIDVVAVVKVL